MQKFIWQNPNYPNFTYDKVYILSLLSNAKMKQGFLLGKMSAIGFNDEKKTFLNVVAQDVIKSSEIEGLRLNVEPGQQNSGKVTPHHGLLKSMPTNTFNAFFFLSHYHTLWP